jgi:acyl-lipid omega-6 desaturase (Delta-12 desaturase)
MVILRLLSENPFRRSTHRMQGMHCPLQHESHDELTVKSLISVYVIRHSWAELRGLRVQTAKDGHYPAELRGLVIELHNHCKAYMNADDHRAWWQLWSTALIFFPLVTLMFWLQPLTTPWAFLLALPLGGLLTRFFSLQHDCGHGSFFSSKRKNEFIGQFISILTFTPYDHWRNSHAQHHAGSGNLDRRGIGDIETITVEEFHSLSASAKCKYRLLRHPVFALVIGPPLYFLVLQRVTFDTTTHRTRVWPGLLVHNLALVAFYGGVCWFLGTALTLSVIVPSVLVGTWIGGWLFFVQHQFEETLWDGADAWDVKIAALKGSSHLQLPAVLNWLTCDIGLHHIHHLSSRIPNYRLRACMAASEALQTIAPKLTLWRALTSMHLALWDEKARRLISFREYRLQHA